MDRSTQAGRPIDDRNLHSRRRNPTRQLPRQKEPKWQTLPHRPGTLLSTASICTTKSTAPADRDRPLGYEQMADDTAALLRHLNIDSADVFGYSLGGGVAWQLAIRHLELVRKLVVASATYNNEGIYPEVLAGIETMFTPEAFAGSPIEAAYVRVAPKPDDFPALVVKVQRLTREFVGWPPEAIRAIAAPTLIIIGDSDIIRPEGAVELL